MFLNNIHRGAESAPPDIGLTLAGYIFLADNKIVEAPILEDLWKFEAHNMINIIFLLTEIWRFKMAPGTPLIFTVLKMNSLCLTFDNSAPFPKIWVFLCVLKLTQLLFGMTLNIWIWRTFIKNLKMNLKNLYFIRPATKSFMLLVERNCYSNLGQSHGVQRFAIP